MLVGVGLMGAVGAAVAVVVGETVDMVEEETTVLVGTTVVEGGD